VAVVTLGYRGDVDEARLEDTKYGTAPATEGWFVVNVRDAAWMRNSKFGSACIIESADVQFPQIGYTIAVLGRGESGGLYHREADQEDFLVLAGECVAIIEGEERRLRGWDFVHCPAGTEHIFVGAGDAPCVIFMAGARAHRGSAVYPRNEVALRHGAGVEVETARSHDAYAPVPAHEPGPPASFAGLPFG
jgi:uncharacterized cupin superfamily protein